MVYERISEQEGYLYNWNNQQVLLNRTKGSLIGDPADKKYRVVVIEIGAGVAIPTVRYRQDIFISLSLYYLFISSFYFVDLRFI